MNEPFHLHLWNGKCSDDKSKLISTVKINPNLKQLATCSSDKSIRIWDLETGKLIKTLIGHTAGVSDIAFSPNGRYLASASDDLTIRIWDTFTFSCIKILKSHTYHVNCLKFDSRSRILISGSSDENIRVWDIVRGRSMRTLSAHSDPVASIDLSFDDTIIVSGSHDGLIRLFDTENGACLKTLISNIPLSQVKFSPNARYVLASTLDGKLKLWDYMNNKVVKTFKGFNDGTVGTKYSLGVSFVNIKNVPLICSGDDNGNILFWDIQSKEIVHSISLGTKSIMNVDFCGQYMASVSLDGDLNVWELL